MAKENQSYGNSSNSEFSGGSQQENTRQGSGVSQSGYSNQSSTQLGQSCLSNLAFDWLTFVQKKAKAVKAYDQYIQDAQNANATDCAEFFRRAQKQDNEQLMEAKKHLTAVLQGKMGSANHEGHQGHPHNQSNK